MESDPQPTKAAWSVWDPLLIFVAAIIVATMASVVAGLVGYFDLELLDQLGDSGTAGDEALAELPKVLVILAPVQFAVMAAGIRLISRRKGTGDIRRDFHIRYQTGDWVALLYGVGMLFALGLLLSLVFRLFGAEPGTQQVVEAAEASENLVELFILTIVIALLAPVAEEILFRGMLFGALKARTSTKRAIWISGIVFGLVHLLDLNSLLLVPALVALGVVLGFMREKTGTLSQPILMHIGFNSVTAISLFAMR